MSARPFVRLCLTLLFTAITLTGLLWTSAAVTADRNTGTKHWLLEAESDEERFRRLEYYLGGFSQSMREVGFRYRYTFFSILDGNFELADYHWDKIRRAIERGYMKRPDRRKNAEEKFLDDDWQVLSDSLKNGDADQIRADFKRARKACMECHKAEDVEFMNNQGLFRDTAEFQKL